MLSNKRNWSIGLVASTVIILGGCGGGGGSSPAPVAAANTGTEVDLADPQTALKVSAILLGASPLGITFGNSAWSAKSYEGASRIENDSCSTSTFTSLDGIPNAGDNWKVDYTNCVLSTTTPGVTYSSSGKGTTTLESLSNSATPDLAAWTARDSGKGTDSPKWTMLVTSNNYRYEGSGESIVDVSNNITHAADGSQSENYRGTYTAKGTENGAAYDYVVSGEGTCTYDAQLKAETCSAARFTLIGQIAGKSVNAVLTQPGPNVTNAGSAYEITQGTQKITITFSFANGFNITTANGSALTARYLNLILIGGY
jgi:hypothetical protein